MTIKKIKPVSNSRRNTVLIDYKKTLVVNRKKKRIRSLFKIVKKKSGRNNQGRITIRHQGGQKKRFYRLISFGPHGKRKEIEVGKIKSIEYNPNSNSFISLVRYEESGKLGFVITNEGQKINDRIVSSKKEAIPIEIGNSLPLRFIPVNTFISNIELRVGDGGKLIRAAGSFAEVKSHDKKEKTVTVQLKSKEIRKINENCMATIGKIGNSECSSVKLGKSGRKR